VTRDAIKSGDGRLFRTGHDSEMQRPRCGTKAGPVLRRRRFDTSSSPGRPNGSRNHDNRAPDVGSRSARCIIRLVARPSGPVSKLIRPPVIFTKKIFSLSGNISIVGPAIGSPRTAVTCAKRRLPWKRGPSESRKE